jgi:hypothetical protein
MRYRGVVFGRLLWPARLLVLVLGLFAWGCASAPTGPPERRLRSLRAATLDEVLAAYDGYCKGLTTLSAAGDLDVADLRAGKTRTVSVRFVADRRGRIYLKGSVAVVTALELVSDGETFWLSLPQKKTVWTGPARSAGREGDRDAPYYALRPDDLSDAFFPKALAPSPDEVVLFEGDDQGFSLTLARAQEGRGTVERRVFLSRETLEPRLIRTYDPKGDVRLEVSFEGWAQGAPRTIDVLRPVEGYRATFRLTKFDRNGALPEKAFLPRLPEGYAVKEVPN